MFSWMQSSRCESSSCVQIAYSKSSRCQLEHCVEIGWSRSIKCEHDQCVEVSNCACGVKMRDSKDLEGPVLSFNKDQWNEFIKGIKNDNTV